MTAVKPIVNLQTIISVPDGIKIGFFLDDPLDCLKLQSVVDAIRVSDVDGVVPPTVIVPTHPMVICGHQVGYGDLVFEDPQSCTTRVLYQETLHGPMQGVPLIFNRAVMLPAYLYEAGAAPCFDICFVFCEQAAGEEVVARSEQIGTETIFISLPDLRSYQTLKGI